MLVVEGRAMADVATRLSRARELHLQSRWAEACEEFAAADRLEPLDAEDLEVFAEAAQVLGRARRRSGLFGVPTNCVSRQENSTELSPLPSGGGRP
jgi:hypothetical protein